MKKLITLAVALLLLSGCTALREQWEALDRYAREEQGDWGSSEQEVVRPDPIRPGAYTVRKK